MESTLFALFYSVVLSINEKMSVAMPNSCIFLFQGFKVLKNRKRF